MRVFIVPMHPESGVSFEAIARMESLKKETAAANRRAHGLPEDATDEQLDDADRRSEAEIAGLPPDATWEQIREVRQPTA